MLLVSIKSHSMSTARATAIPEAKNKVNLFVRLQMNTYPASKRQPTAQRIHVDAAQQFPMRTQTPMIPKAITATQQMSFCGPAEGRGQMGKAICCSTDLVWKQKEMTKSTPQGRAKQRRISINLADKFAACKCSNPQVRRCSRNVIVIQTYNKIYLMIRNQSTLYIKQNKNQQKV